MSDFDNLINKLDSCIASYDNITETALKNTATKVIIDAKMNCPVKTGALRDSIHYENLNPNSVEITTRGRGVEGYADGQEFGYTTTRGNYFQGKHMVTNAVDRNADSKSIANEIINEVVTRLK